MLLKRALIINKFAGQRYFSASALSFDKMNTQYQAQLNAKETKIKNELQIHLPFVANKAHSKIKFFKNQTFSEL